jgi:hypothetical protein
MPVDPKDAPFPTKQLIIIGAMRLCCVMSF